MTLDPAQNYPEQISIATQKVHADKNPYVYTFDTTVRVYMCKTPTNNGLPDEVLVLIKEAMQDGVWFLAVEGSLRDGDFQARQSVFRTQENFWEAGQHRWQINKKAGRKAVGQVPDAKWERDLTAETKVDSEWVLKSETKVE